jgi:aldose 1-epimerase
MKKLFPALSALLFSSPLAMSQATITKEPFGNLKDGRAVSLYTLAAKDGASVRITNFGGIIVSIDVPDRSGKLDSVVLGKDSIAEYEAGHPFFGCLTGRYANRIAKGKFTLDGTAHFLAVNNGPNSLHGGKEGFDKKLWSVKSAILKDGAPTLVLAYSSPDGEENYPGKLDCEVTYSFNDQHELSISYSAVTDKPTVVNLTNHSYFNLAGHGHGTILDHILEMPCGSYTDTDATLIPTGEVLSVTGTPLDFLKPTRIGDRIDKTDFLPIKYGEGYDHNFVINGPRGELRTAAKVKDPVSGRTLECLTTEPAVQLYTANHLEKEYKGRDGRTYTRRGAFCLETQHFPDSPNHPSFPSTILRPGETYQHTCVYRFGVAK